MKKTNQFFLSENNVPFQEYFGFGLSVDCVVFGYRERELRVLLIERGAGPYKGYWALPGDLVAMDQDLRDSASDVLTRLTGLTNIFMEQFYTFGSKDRHPAGRVATVAYYSLVNSEKYQPVASSWAESTRWFSIDELPDLAFDHSKILDRAIDTLKTRVRYRPVGFELLQEKFTLLELQALYETLLRVKFDKPNFRKRILSKNLLIQLDEVQENVSHRPAKLFKFDEDRYHKLKQDGFSFDI
jgi:8-oxo-dGTP diphosphatase